MKLLVSPSSIEEAKFCLDADIIDVKRPAEGSLGANFPWVIREIKKLAGDKPVSAAIGDYGPTPGNAALAAYGAACAGADFVKIGLMFNDTNAARDVIEGVVRAVKEPFPEKTVVLPHTPTMSGSGPLLPISCPRSPPSAVPILP